LEIEDEEWMSKDPEGYILETMYSTHHLIGGLHDSVDSNFEAKGTKNLFVCDASVFDQYVASNIHSSVVLLSDLFAKKFIKMNNN
jgi:choline dehydrogenase-like flavoprotein